MDPNIHGASFSGSKSQPAVDGEVVQASTFCKGKKNAKNGIVDGQNDKFNLVLLSDNSDMDPNYLQDSNSSDSESDSATFADKEVPGASTARKERKRTRNESLWGQNNRKHKRNHGQEYTTAEGKRIQAKVFEHKDCSCTKNCISRISFEARNKLFEKFWRIGNFQEQNLFLNSCAHRQLIKVRRPRSDKPMIRECHYTYYLTTDNVTVKICKRFFLDTYQVSVGRLARVLKKNTSNSDLRGKMEGSSRKTNDDLLKFARNHIKRFPSFESHYTRAHNPGRKYLDPNLDLRKMYNLYLESCNENNLPNIKEWTYRKIFNTEFNLHFHQPRKDTCQKCDMWKLKIQNTGNENEKQNLQQEHDKHLKNAELARESMKNDQTKAQQNPEDNLVFTFDLQKALPYPKLTVSVAYYKRNMYVLNLGLHTLNDNNDVDMYMWDESTASRGAQEVAYCIKKHLETNVTSQKNIVAYSDACTGQNRNIKMALMWMKFVQSSEKENLRCVDHKFMVSGHSFLPNDRDFGVIEVSIRKTSNLYVPEQYFNLITKCRKKRPFKVHKMLQRDFLSTKRLEDAISKRSKNTQGDNVNWLKIQWIRFLKSQPYKMFYKISLNDDSPFLILDLTPKRGRPRDYANIALTRLNKNIRPVSAAKYKDMMDLLPYIPPVHHDHFKSLKQTESCSGEEITPISEGEED